MSRKLTIDDIKQRCIKIHEDKYIIPEQKYIGVFEKIKIICKIHGEFFITTKNLLSGHGCSKCKKVDQLTLFDLRKRIKIDIIIPEQEYININSKIKVICKKHPDYNWYITPAGLLRCKGCPKCTKRQKLSISEIRNKCDVIHKNKGYIIEDQNYINNNTKIKITCPIHGDWLTRPQILLNGSGCPICKESKGEQLISNILENNKIKYIRQKTFDDCRNIKKLKFDFYLPDYNTCIEFDGEQHFVKFRFEKDDNKLRIRQKLDNIKNNYCLKNNIYLCRIRYDENINEKIINMLKLIYN